MGRGKVSLRVGYCESFQLSDFVATLTGPFVATWCWSGSYPVLCKGPWSLGDEISLEEYRFHPAKIEPWMLITIDDILDVQHYCKFIPGDLPADGFRRNTAL